VTVGETNGVFVTVEVAIGVEVGPRRGTIACACAASSKAMTSRPTLSLIVITEQRKSWLS